MLFKQKSIDRQIEHFYKNACRRSLYTANEHREWVLKFVKLNNLNDVYDVLENREGKIQYFKKWLLENYSSQVMQTDAISSINKFLKFYHCVLWGEVI